MTLAEFLIVSITAITCIAIFVVEVWRDDIAEWWINRRYVKQDRKLKQRLQQEREEELAGITQEMAEELDRQARYKERQERRAA